MVISGILLGVVTLHSTVGEREWLRQEARRIALLLQMARDEAIVRDRSISLVLDEYRYRFLIRQNTQWELMADDPIWRERETATQGLVSHGALANSQTGTTSTQLVWRGVEMSLQLADKTGPLTKLFLLGTT